MEMGSIDLIDCHMGRREVPNFQVGRGKEMRLSESLRSSEVSSIQQGVLTEEDQKSIMIIGGISIFLPISPAEASAHLEDAAEKGQPTKTIKEEKEQTLMSTPAEKEENSYELLTQWKKEINMLEDWLDNPKPEDGF